MREMECNSKNDSADSQPSWWDSWWKNREQRRMAQLAHDEEKFVETARIYKQAERWEDMAQLMRKVIKLCYAQKKDLSSEERSFLLDSYHHLIESHMTSWRRLPKADTKLLNEEIVEVRKERRDVEWEIREICEAMIRLQDDFLIPLASVDSACDLYLDVRKQYYKYLEEIGAPQDINDVFFYSF
ncbi:14-3-3 protein [Ditylenchus destructor]|nr:14-3-3 protein [Ditylenchus destructor]